MQGEQLDNPPAEYDPPEQELQTELVCAPRATEYLPAGQLAHTESPPVGP